MKGILMNGGGLWRSACIARRSAGVAGPGLRRFDIFARYSGFRCMSNDVRKEGGKGEEVFDFGNDERAFGIGDKDDPDWKELVSTPMELVKKASRELVPEGLFPEEGKGRTQEEHSEDLISCLQGLNLVKDDRLAGAMKKLNRNYFISRVQENDPETLDDAYSTAREPVGAYDENYFPLSNPFSHASELTELEKVLQPGARVLDCGSGSGYMTALMALLVADGQGAENGCVVAVDRLGKTVDESVVRISKSLKALSDVDESILHRIMVLPIDATEDVYLPKAPYDAIRVGYRVPHEAIGQDEVQFLFRQLKPGGRMIYYADYEDDGNHLVILDKDEDGAMSIDSSMFEPIFVPELVEKKVVATSDNPEEDKKLGVLLEQQREERDKVMNSLQDWKAEFSSKNGRMPSRDEMFADPVASVLFKRFSQLNSNL